MRVLSIDPGLRNLAVCVIDVNEGDVALLHWGLVDLGEDMTAWEYVQAFADYIETNRFADMSITHAVIEQQFVGDRGYKASRMYAVSLGMAGVLTGIGQRAVFMSAGSKLCVFDLRGITYEARKRRIVQVVYNLLRALGLPTTTLDVADKQDDLADSFAQAIVFAVRISKDNRPLSRYFTYLRNSHTL